MRRRSRVVLLLERATRVEFGFGFLALASPWRLGDLSWYPGGRNVIHDRMTDDWISVEGTFHS